MSTSSKSSQQSIKVGRKGKEPITFDSPASSSSSSSSSKSGKQIHVKPATQEVTRPPLIADTLPKGRATAEQVRGWFAPQEATPTRSTVSDIESDRDQPHEGQPYDGNGFAGFSTEKMPLDYYIYRGSEYSEVASSYYKKSSYPKLKDGSNYA